MMSESFEKPIVNPSIVLREEFDDWAILYDPDTGDAYGINPTGAYIWKRLDGRHTVNEVLSDLNTDYTGVPENVTECVDTFIKELASHGMVGTEAIVKKGLI
jgi:SynChlorMet cassette protein ScmD